MRKQNPSSVSGEQSAKTRASAHASQEITPLHVAADARAASNNNGNDDSNSNNYNNLKDPPRWVPAKANDTTDALH